MLSQKDVQKKLLKIMKKKKYRMQDYNLFEFYIQLYLILGKKRKIAQIFYPIDQLKKMKTYLDKNYPYYFIRKEKNKQKRAWILLFDSKYPIQQLNKTFSKKYAKDLGDFYVCAGNLNKIYKKHKYLLRPSIKVSYTNKNGDILDMEIFGQMCPPSKCIQHLKQFYKIEAKFQKYLLKINKSIRVRFSINPFVLK